MLSFRPHRRRLLLLLLVLPAAFGRPALAAPPSLTGVSVDFTDFSPDGDGVQDEVRYFYTLGGDTAQVTVEVRRTSETGPVVIALLDVQRATGPDTVAWDGRDGGGTLQADDFYWIVATASNPDSTVSAVPIRVRLDTVGPQIVIDEVQNPYTPDLPGADSLARVTVTVSNAGSDDRILIDFTPRDGGEIGSLLANLGADGQRVFGWDGRGFADGLYAVSARAFDDAGHTWDAVGPDLNLDAAAPTDTITMPAGSPVDALVRRVEGEARDRNGFSKIVLAVTSQGGTVVDSLCPCPQSVVPFALDLPDSVAAGDTLTITVQATDVFGQENTSTTTVHVDTIGPPAPSFDPLPSRVSRAPLVFNGTAIGADSVLVQLNGAIARRLTVGVTERFSGTVTLEIGANTLQAQSKDEAGNLSPLSAPHRVTFENELGVSVPERFQDGDAVLVTLTEPGRSVRVEIYTLHGRRLRTLESVEATTNYELSWDLRDESGDEVGSGPCVFRIVAVEQDGVRLERRVVAVVTR